MADPTDNGLAEIEHTPSREFLYEQGPEKPKWPECKWGHSAARDLRQLEVFFPTWHGEKNAALEKFGDDLSEAEFVALRLYTTIAFKVINNSLRNVVNQDAGGEQPKHPLPTTVKYIFEAIKQLRKVATEHPLANTRIDLWRGMRDLEVSSDFLSIGGTEVTLRSNQTYVVGALIAGSVRTHKSRSRL